ncbi:MAG TPA: FHA domain-containing protein [Steroidobacteraceae bacterium]|nr:FHA domain-containing protein [Steroidobacteraceae bacterium]
MADNHPKLIKVSTQREIPIKPDMVVGRQAECDLQLTEGHASRKHARLLIADDGVWVEDLNSANGTFVNGAKITGKAKLSSGDRLRFDVEEFDFRIPATAPAVDDGKTQYREPASAAVVAESSGVYKRPGAWADPDAMGDGANKTKFIDPAQMKQMMNEPSAASAVNTASIDGPHLHIVSGSRAGLNIKLTVGESGAREWTIGSQADREVQFQDSGVSALHAKIVNEGERWKVLDQMSANGTYVNGKRANVSYLTAGDRVRFGPVECIFQTSRGGGSRPAASHGPRAESKGKTLLIAGIAFAATIVVLVVVYKFVL